MIQDIWMVRGWDHVQSLRDACPLETRPQCWARILVKRLKHLGSPSWAVFLPPRKSQSPSDPSDFSFALKHSALSPRGLFMSPPSAVCPSSFLSLVIYWPNHETRGILVPRPGIKPEPRYSGSGEHQGGPSALLHSLPRASAGLLRPVFSAWNFSGCASWVYQVFIVWLLHVHMGELSRLGREKKRYCLTRPEVPRPALARSHPEGPSWGRTDRRSLTRRCPWSSACYGKASRSSPPHGWCPVCLLPAFSH